MQSCAMCRSPLHHRHCWGQLAGFHPMRRGDAIEAFAVKNYQDAHRWSITHRLASACWPSWLSRGGRWSRLLPVEDRHPSTLREETHPRRPRRWHAGMRPSTGRAGMPYNIYGRGRLRFPAFAQHPSDPPPHRHGLTSEVGCATGTSQVASTSSATAAMAPNKPCQGRGRGGGCHLFHVGVIEKVVVRPR
jgi:hypothetical protein